MKKFNMPMAALMSAMLAAGIGSLSWANEPAPAEPHKGEAAMDLEALAKAKAKKEAEAKAAAGKPAEPKAAEKPAEAKPAESKAAEKPAEEKTLAEKIKDGLAGKGDATLKLSKEAPKDAHAGAHPTASASGGHAANPAAAKAHAAPKAHAEGNHKHWSYEGAQGPEHWADLDPANASCRDGKRQSPILIESEKTAMGPLDDLEFNYAQTPAKILNNGHTIQIDMGEGSSIVARGETYKLVQFHFHHPSEEKIDFKGYPMVAHMVHKSESGSLAVVAVELDIGAPNPAVERAWKSMPFEAGDRAGIPGGLNPMGLLPANRKYFMFLGSLTTPPCTEGVLWLVLKTPMTVSRDQLSAFKKFYPFNARPTQSVNGRMIREQE